MKCCGPADSGAEGNHSFSTTARCWMSWLLSRKREALRQGRRMCTSMSLLSSSGRANGDHSVHRSSDASSRWLRRPGGVQWGKHKGTLMAQPHILPRRSALYVPGSNARALEKARTLDADVVIIDLEDAVAESQKTVAREQVLKALKTGGYKSEMAGRVNDPRAPAGPAEMNATAASGCGPRLLPTTET